MAHTFTLATGHVVEIRALTDGEIDAARESAGALPMWGQKVNDRVARALDELVDKYTAAAEAIPALVRPDEEEIRARAYAEVREQMLEHDPEGWKAREAFNIWSINVLARTAAMGLVKVEGWGPLPESPADVQALIEALPDADPVRFVADAGTKVREVTQATEGKGQAPRLPSTSPPVEAKVSGAPAATAATTA